MSESQSNVGVKVSVPPMTLEHATVIGIGNFRKGIECPRRVRLETDGQFDAPAAYHLGKLGVPFSVIANTFASCAGASETTNTPFNFNRPECNSCPGAAKCPFDIDSAVVSLQETLGNLGANITDR